jgi:hypothetical protein
MWLPSPDARYAQKWLEVMSVVCVCVCVCVCALAEEADNVFFHLTYEGAVDVSKVNWTYQR